MGEKLKVLDLFSGIGGFSLGLERTGGFETVAFCEIDPFCQKVLKKHWPDVPIFDDVRTLNYDGAVDVITGGDPCQPHSNSGKRKGKDDERYLWPAMFELVKKYRPIWIIRENVRGNISNGILDQVEHDLEGEGYSKRTYLLPAYSIGAPHERFRTWTIAYSSGSKDSRIFQSGLQPDTFRGLAPNTTQIERLCKSDFEEETERLFDYANYWQCSPWDETKSRVRRMDDGLPHCTHRLEQLGNSIVPQFPELIGHAILEAEAA